MTDDLVIGDKVRLSNEVIADLPFWSRGRGLDGVLTVMEINDDTIGAFTASDKKNGYCGKRCCFIKVS